jgi:hypothetical protein
MKKGGKGADWWGVYQPGGVLIPSTKRRACWLAKVDFVDDCGLADWKVAAALGYRVYKNGRLPFTDNGWKERFGVLMGEREISMIYAPALVCASPVEFLAKAAEAARQRFTSSWR